MHETKAPVGEPAGLGLLGLAIVTLVACSDKLGWTEGVSLVLPWALFLGATAQLIAAGYDFKRHNVFGGTAFAGYALFWYAVGMSWMVKAGVFGAGLSQVDGRQLGFAFLGYLIFTLYMTIGALTTNKVLFFIFLSIDFLFVGLTLSSFGVSPALSLKLAGTSELVISLLSFYGSAATILNIQFGRTVLPMGKAFHASSQLEAAH